MAAGVTSTSSHFTVRDGQEVIRIDREVQRDAGRRFYVVSRNGVTGFVDEKVLADLLAEKGINCVWGTNFIVSAEAR